MKDQAKLIVGALLVAAVTLTIFVTRTGERSRVPERVAARAVPDAAATAAADTPAVPTTRPGAASDEARAAAVAAGTSPAVQAVRSGLSFGAAWEQPGAAPELTRFAEWVARYRSAQTDEERAALAVEGRRLAEERLTAMTDLIRVDPEQALERAIPYAVRQELPESVTSQLEKFVSDRGPLSVFAALPEPGKEGEVRPVWRVATIGGEDYDAYVYGRRLGEPTRRDILLNGIAIGSLLALSANPVRVLDAAESAALAPGAPDALCAMSGQSAAANQTPTAAVVGGRTMRICGLGHANDLNERYIQAEGGDGSGGDGVQGSAYTEGVKRLLVIRVDFPDLPGDPFPTATGTAMISGLNDFFRESSYDRAGFFLSGAGSEVTPTLRMTNNASYYGTNDYYTRLQNDARAAATAAGYNVANYDFDMTCFGAVPGWGWAGLGWVGASGVWLRSYFTTGVAAHELGHNLGLNHANYWDTGGRSVIGAGSSAEYGDSFDTMGSAAAGANHFNARYKSYLNWLVASGVQSVTNSGTYRIQAHDDTNSTGLRALRIARNSNTNFWVEFRQKFTGNVWMMNGAGLRWAGNGNQRSDLLDTTPGSANGKNDSPLVVGRTFSDTAAGIHITTLRKAGTTPESLDVVVNLGTFPANTAPTVTVGASSTSVALSTPVTFTASASDANGDSLAYYWDFGDGTFGTNGAVASKSWSISSEFRVQCTVTDMKGGTSTDSIIVAVGAPTTYRISGQVTAGGAPLSGARVYTSASRMTYTDSDGTYSLVGLPASTYTVNVSRDPYTNFTASFANPVTVGPSASSINFAATGVTNSGPAITSQPQSVTVAAGGTASFSVTASGSGLGYVWRSNGTNVPGGNAATLSLVNVQSAHAGGYSVVVSNSGGSTTSSVAILTVVQPPGITAQPQSQTIGVGGSATLSVTASGTAPLAYQWWRNGSVLPGAASSSLQFNPAAATNAADYLVVVTNLAGSVTSSVATLTVILSPVISVQPQSRTVLAGTNVSLAVTASGSAPLVFQWWKNGSPVPGAASSSLVFSPVAPADAGSYQVVITNSVGAITSSVATLVVNCSYSLSASSATIPAAGGNGSVTLTSPGPCSWSVTGVPAWATLTSASSGSGNAAVTYTVVTNSSGAARSATLSIAGLSYTLSQPAPDLTPPVAAFTSPADGFTTTETNLLVQGTASDNVSVSRVELRLGAGSFVTVSGTTSWSSIVALPLGTNVVTVRAVDTTGRLSPEVQRTFVAVSPGTIQVNVNGNGSVKGATNGQRLKVGKSYTVTAVAAEGYAFSNWTGSIVQSSPALTFVMQTNLQVVANFVLNPFVASKGAFNGLFYETNEVHPDRSGAFTLSMTVKGAYTASILTRGLKLKAKGAFDLTGRATNVIVSPLGTYTVTWAVAFDGSDQISGLVSAGNWSAPLLGDRLVYHPKTNAASYAGRYTALVLGDTGQTSAPGGDSYGLVTVDAKGTALFSGYLADNTRFVARSSLSRSGNWPVYASLYGRQGAILGWVGFRDLSSTDFDGILSWTRPAISGSALYPAGFTSEAAVVGSRYVAPASGAAVVDWTDPLISFVGGSLAGACTNSISVTGSTVINEGPDALSLKIASPSGLFSGVLTRPDTGLPLPFRGVVLQKPGLGSGYFLGTNTTGQVRIE